MFWSFQKERADGCDAAGSFTISLCISFQLSPVCYGRTNLLRFSASIFECLPDIFVQDLCLSDATWCGIISLSSCCTHVFFVARSFCHVSFYHISWFVLSPYPRARLTHFAGRCGPGLLASWIVCIDSGVHARRLDQNHFAVCYGFCSFVPRQSSISSKQFIGSNLLVLEILKYSGFWLLLLDLPDVSMSVYTLQKQWDSYQISTEKCVVCVFCCVYCVCVCVRLVCLCICCMWCLCMLCHYTLHSCLSYTFPRSFPNDALSLYQMSLHSRSHTVRSECVRLSQLCPIFLSSMTG